MLESGMIGSFDNLLYQFGTAIAGVMAVISIVLGVVECYFGYKVFKLLMAITGFFVGCGLGGAIGTGLLLQSGASGGIVVILALVGGVIGVLVAVKVYFLGVFLYGFAVGFLVVLIFGGSTVSGAILGIIGGLLLVFFNRVLIIVSTAIAGGTCLGMGLGMLLYSCGIWMNFAVKILTSIVFIATGLYYQFKVNGGLPRVKGMEKKVETSSLATEEELLYSAPSAAVFCEECGMKLDGDSAFCGNCGSKVD